MAKKNLPAEVLAALHAGVATTTQVDAAAVGADTPSPAEPKQPEVKAEAGGEGEQPTPAGEQPAPQVDANANPNANTNANPNANPNANVQTSELVTHLREEVKSVRAELSTAQAELTAAKVEATASKTKMEAQDGQIAQLRAVVEASIKVQAVALNASHPELNTLAPDALVQLHTTFKTQMEKKFPIGGVAKPVAVEAKDAQRTAALPSPAAAAAVASSTV